MKGTLEGCILQILSETVTYGYEIVTTLTEFGFEDVKEGSIYPLLVRLEKKGIRINGSMILNVLPDPGVPTTHVPRKQLVMLVQPLRNLPL